MTVLIAVFSLGQLQAQQNQRLAFVDSDYILTNIPE